MPQGLEVFNEAGQRVIDPELKNFALVSSGRVNPTSVIGSFWYRDITFTGRTSPILAINAGGNWAGLLGVTVSGTTYTWRIVTTVSNANIDYWLFDEAPASSNFGLEAFNSAGQRVWHSGLGAMRVVGFQSNGQGSGVDYNGVVSEKIAVAQAAPGRFDFFEPNSGPPQINEERDDQMVTYIHGVRFPTSREFSVDYNSFGAVIGSGSNVLDPVPDFLIIDVSDLGAYGQGTPPPDVTPNAVNWANISSGLNYAENLNVTVSGIDVGITLEATSSNGNCSVIPIVGGVDQLPGPFNVNNNNAVRFEVRHQTASPQSGTVTVRNTSDGNVTLDTFTFSLAATGDTTPNAVNWTDIVETLSTQANTNTQTISGITQQITLDIDNPQGNLLIQPYVNGSLVSAPANQFTVNNGDTVYFSVSNFASSAVNESVIIRNVDDSNIILDTFNVELAGGGGFGF